MARYMAAANNMFWTLNLTSGVLTFVNNASGTVLGLAPTSPLVTPQILPQFVFGGGWYSALYFTNSSAGAVSFPVSFISDSGAPLTVPSLGASTTVNLAPQATFIQEALDVGSLSEGYVIVSLPSGVTGYAVFRESVHGIADQEAVALLASASAASSTLVWGDTAFTTSIAS